MKPRSFGVRLALLSAALSGLVLAAFAVWAWIAVSRVSLQAIDREILDRAAPHLATPHEPQHWRQFEATLPRIYGERGRGSVILLVRGRAGEVLCRSPHWPKDLSDREFRPPDPGDPAFRRPPPRGRPPRPLGPAPLPMRPPALMTRRAGEDRWRLGVLANPEVTLVLGMRLDAFTADQRHVRDAFLMALPLALLLIGVAAWLIARRALRPVHKLTAVAESITAGGLDYRIPLGGEDAEFYRLITVFNRMMDRLQRSFAQAARFSADAAHELKTPLTVLQGELEQAVQNALPNSEEQAAYNELLEEVQRLKEIVRKLLLLSQADAGKLPLTPEPFDLAAEVEAVCEDAEAMAPHLEIVRDLETGLQVRADVDLMSQVLRNLTLNAIKHNREGGRIEYRLRRAGSTVRLALANTGDAIPLEHRDRIFERFHRADPSRSRRVDGVGLGLSLAREIVRAHGGELTLADSGEDLTVFSLTLPLTDSRSPVTALGDTTRTAE
jgi:heavy metal sensor kinase